MSFKSKSVCVLAVFSLLLLFLSSSPAPLAAQDIQVNSADPPSAAQGTVNLNVTIKGKGFKKGAQAQWFVSGTTNPGGVTVNSTIFVSPNELRANINVADDATLASFDIQVSLSDGRTGKGVGLFSVTEKPNSCTSDVQLKVVFAPGNGTSLRRIFGDSDFGSTANTYSNANDPEFDGGSLYADGVGGVYAQFQVCNGSNDFIMSLGDSTRHVNFDFSEQLVSPDPGAEDLVGKTYKAGFFNGNVMFNTPLAGTFTTCLGGQLAGIAKRAAFKFQNPSTYQINGGPCQGGGLAQVANQGGDTSLIRVEHPDACTWIIRPVADSGGFDRGGVAETLKNNKVVSGGQYNLPFAIKLIRAGCQ